MTIQLVMQSLQTDSLWKYCINKTHLVIFDTLHGEMVAVDPNSISQNVNAIIFLLLENL